MYADLKQRSPNFARIPSLVGERVCIIRRVLLLSHSDLPFTSLAGDAHVRTVRVGDVQRVIGIVATRPCTRRLLQRLIFELSRRRLPSKPREIHQLLWKSMSLQEFHAPALPRCSPLHQGMHSWAGDSRFLQDDTVISRYSSTSLNRLLQRIWTRALHQHLFYTARALLSFSILDLFKSSCKTSVQKHTSRAFGEVDSAALCVHARSLHARPF